MKRYLFITLLLAASAGCAIRKNFETPFAPPSNTPIIDDQSQGSAGTKFCKPSANGKFEEQDPTPAQGQHGVDSGIGWAQGGGCVLRPIRVVWAALNNLDQIRWQSSDSYTVTETNNTIPGFMHLYVVTYSKSTAIGSISWTLDWFHGFDQGTFEAPMRINIKYDRSNGTELIPVWNGGLVISKVLDSVTSVGVLNRFQAAQDDGDNETSAVQGLTELVRHARTATPDWTRLNSGIKNNPSQPDPPIPPYH